VAADLEQQHAATEQRRDGLDALVRAAYEGSGVSPTVTAIMTGDPRALTDLARVQAGVVRSGVAQRADLQSLADQRGATERLLARRQSLRRAALVERQALEARQAELVSRSAALSARLTTVAAALSSALDREAEQARAQAAARAAAAAAQARAQAEALAWASATSPAPAPAGAPDLTDPTSWVPGVVVPSTGGGCAPVSQDHGYANGFLPDAVLCPWPGRPGKRLRTDAAQSFVAMDAARVAAGGAPLCVTDSYRSYAAQVDVFARKPGLAAVPGRSKHGWGLAVDFCGGVQSFDGEAHHWMQANAARYGWVHPAWAEPGGSMPEPWHWEFQG
jgi:hypothetical protein